MKISVHAVDLEEEADRQQEEEKAKLIKSKLIKGIKTKKSNG